MGGTDLEAGIDTDAQQSSFERRTQSIVEAPASPRKPARRRRVHDVGSGGDGNSWRRCRF
jgi:hypothetical protein